jgi:hypothetical protein
MYEDSTHIKGLVNSKYQLNNMVPNWLASFAFHDSMPGRGWRDLAQACKILED